MTAKNDDSWMRDFLAEEGIYKRPEGDDRIRDVLEAVLARLDRVEGVLFTEEILRKDHPALEDAWKKYLTIRNLVKKHEDS